MEENLRKKMMTTSLIIWGVIILIMAAYIFLSPIGGKCVGTVIFTILVIIGYMIMKIRYKYELEMYRKSFKFAPAKNVFNIMRLGLFKGKVDYPLIPVAIWFDDYYNITSEACYSSKDSKITLTEFSIKKNIGKNRWQQLHQGFCLSIGIENPDGEIFTIDRGCNKENILKLSETIKLGGDFYKQYRALVPESRKSEQPSQWVLDRIERIKEFLKDAQIKFRHSVLIEGNLLTVALSNDGEELMKTPLFPFTVGKAIDRDTYYYRAIKDLTEKMQKYFSAN